MKKYIFAGTLIGLIQLPLFFLDRAFLGNTGAYGKVLCYSCTQSLKGYIPFYFAIGIVVGVFFLRKLFKITEYQDHSMPFWISFLGGVFLVFGARLGDGCTSGNGISGLSQLALGSFVFTVSMFVSGIVFARILKRFL